MSCADIRTLSESVFEAFDTDKDGLIDNFDLMDE